ncbi:hypothetical protein ACKLNO_07415 [Neisseriaceae bacterium B1]
MQEALRNWVNKYCRLSQMQMLSAVILSVLMLFFETGYAVIWLFPMFVFSLAHFITYKVIDEDYFDKGEQVNFTGFLEFNRVASIFAFILLYIVLDENLITKLIYLGYFVFFHMIKPYFLLKEFKSLNYQKPIDLN